VVARRHPLKTHTPHATHNAHNAHNAQQVDPQFFAFRWITLLLTQEFPFPDAVRIWDTLLSDPAGRVDCLMRVCVTMLTNVRETLLAGARARARVCVCVCVCVCVRAHGAGRVARRVRCAPGVCAPVRVCRCVCVCVCVCVRVCAAPAPPVHLPSLLNQPSARARACVHVCVSLRLCPCVNTNHTRTRACAPCRRLCGHRQDAAALPLLRRRHAAARGLTPAALRERAGRAAVTCCVVCVCACVCACVCVCVCVRVCVCACVCVA
jgi:hypothetical protein